MKSLFVLGILKLVFGVVVGALGVWIGLRLLGRLLRHVDEEKSLAQGNIAMGVLNAASLIALGLMSQHAIQASFDALDLITRGQDVHAAQLLKFAIHALLHVSAALVVSVLVIAFGVKLFGFLTRDVDELAEVRRGNIAPALVLAGVIIVMALVAAPGLRSTLDGLLPFPELPRDSIQMPS